MDELLLLAIYLRWRHPNMLNTIRKGNLAKLVKGVGVGAKDVVVGVATVTPDQIGHGIKVGAVGTAKVVTVPVKALTRREQRAARRQAINAAMWKVAVVDVLGTTPDATLKVVRSAKAPVS